MDDKALYLVWFAVVTAAYFVKGVAGFGNSPIHTGVMALFKNNADLTPVDFLLTMPANIVLTIRHRAYLKKEYWLPGCIVTMICVVPGGLLLANMDKGALKAVFGVVIVALGADMLRRKPAGRKPPSTGIVLLLTALSGVVNGLFGIGVLLAAALGRVIEDTRVLKANMSLIFVAGNLVMLVVYGAEGLLTGEVIRRVLTLYPPMGLGLFLGIRCAGRLSERAVRLAAAVLLIFCGLALVIGNL